MAFAIFYGHIYLTSIVANAVPVMLSGADKSLATKVWNGGLKTWQAAPYGQSPYEQPDPGGTLCRTVVVDSSVTLQEFRDLLYRIAARLGATPDVQYLKALADDMGRNCGAVEPWPVV